MSANFPGNPQIGNTVTIENIKRIWTGITWAVDSSEVQASIVQSNNGTIDLSKGDYHKILIDPDNLNVTVNFANIPSSSSKWYLELTTNAPQSSYDVPNASYDNISFSVATQSTFPRTVIFNDVGNKMYVIEQQNDTIYQYNLSSSFNISTAVYSNTSFATTSQATTPVSLAFNTDGTKMFVLDGTSRRVFQYALSTPYNLSTVSYSSISFDTSSQETDVRTVIFNDTGTKMYITGVVSDSVHQYTLSTPFNLSSASYDSILLNVSALDTAPTGIAFDDNGDRLFVFGGNTRKIYQYNLSSAFNISTAVYSNTSFDTTAQESTPTAMSFSADGQKMYIIGRGTDAIYQYTSGSALVYSLTWPTSIIWNQDTAPTITSEQNLILELYTSDGGTTIYGIESINKDNTV